MKSPQVGLLRSSRLRSVPFSQSQRRTRAKETVRRECLRCGVRPAPVLLEQTTAPDQQLPGACQGPGNVFVWQEDTLRGLRAWFAIRSRCSIPTQEIGFRDTAVTCRLLCRHTSVSIRCKRQTSGSVHKVRRTLDKARPPAIGYRPFVDPHRDARQRQPHSAGPPLTTQRVGQNHARFRHAVALQQRLPCNRACIVAKLTHVTIKVHYSLEEVQRM